MPMWMKSIRIHHRCLQKQSFYGLNHCVWIGCGTGLTLPFAPARSFFARRCVTCLTKRDFSGCCQAHSNCRACTCTMQTKLGIRPMDLLMVSITTNYTSTIQNRGRRVVESRLWKENSHEQQAQLLQHELEGRRWAVHAFVNTVTLPWSGKCITW